MSVRKRQHIIVVDAVEVIVIWRRQEYGRVNNGVQLPSLSDKRKYIKTGRFPFMMHMMPTAVNKEIKQI